MGHEEAEMESGPIIAGTDGSPTADTALARATEIAKALGAPLHIVSGYHPPNGAWMAAAGGMPVGELMSDEVTRGRADEIVTRAKRRAAAHGVPATTHVCPGDPAQALIAIAEDQGAQMIVVGNRGMNGARRMLGSVPNRVSHQARCGVLIVPTC
jgi:nucleotide-binding universal stress UspA family protein